MGTGAGVTAGDRSHFIAGELRRWATLHPPFNHGRLIAAFRYVTLTMSNMERMPNLVVTAPQGPSYSMSITRTILLLCRAHQNNSPTP